MPGQEFGGGEILEILVIGYNIHRSWRTFKVMMPGFECFEYSQEFFVVNIVI